MDGRVRATMATHGHDVKSNYEQVAQKNGIIVHSFTSLSAIDQLYKKFK